MVESKIFGDGGNSLGVSDRVLLPVHIGIPLRTPYRSSLHPATRDGDLDQGRRGGGIYKNQICLELFSWSVSEMVASSGD